MVIQGSRASAVEQHAAAALKERILSDPLKGNQYRAIKLSLHSLRLS